MPTYEAACPDCGHKQDYIRKIADRHNTPDCEHCGAKTALTITAVMVPCMGIADGSMHVVSPIDGTVMRCKDDYESHMKKHNVRPTSEFEGCKPVEKKIDKNAIREAASAAYDKLVRP